MKLIIEFESDGSCKNCPAHVYFETNEYSNEFGACAVLNERLNETYLRHWNCPAKLSSNDEIRAGEIAALKAEIVRLQALVRGEV